MSLQLFKNWLTECQKIDPIFFEAATAAFDVMFENTEDVLEIAKQNLAKEDMQGDDIDLNDIESILNAEEQTTPEESEDVTDPEIQELLAGIDTDQDDEGNDLDIPQDMPKL